MSRKVQIVNVKLGAKLAKRGGGLVDPKSGIAISVAKTSGPEGLAVPKTAFILARIHSGELIEVKPAGDTPGKEPAGDTPGKEPAGDVEVTFRKKVEIGGKEYKIGDKAKLNSTLATTLRDEGKVV